MVICHGRIRKKSPTITNSKHINPTTAGFMHLAPVAFCSCELKIRLAFHVHRDDISCWSPLLFPSYLLHKFPVYVWFHFPVLLASVLLRACLFFGCICPSCMFVLLIVYVRNVAGSSLENHSAVATTPFQLEGIYGAATQRIHCMLTSLSPSWIRFQRYFMKLWSLAWFLIPERLHTFMRPPAFGGFAWRLDADGLPNNASGLVAGSSCWVSPLSPLLPVLLLVQALGFQLCDTPAVIVTPCLCSLIYVRIHQFHQNPKTQKLRTSIEPAEKKGPWLLVGWGKNKGWNILPSYIVIFSETFIRIPINQPGFNGKNWKVGGFFSWLNCFMDALAILWFEGGAS